jgi:hypothetical protein
LLRRRRAGDIVLHAAASERKGRAPHRHIREEEELRRCRRVGGAAATGADEGRAEPCHRWRRRRGGRRRRRGGRPSHHRRTTQPRRRSGPPPSQVNHLWRIRIRHRRSISSLVICERELLCSILLPLDCLDYKLDLGATNLVGLY